MLMWWRDEMRFIPRESGEVAKWDEWEVGSVLHAG
jgi:hypothetical protein